MLYPVILLAFVIIYWISYLQLHTVNTLTCVSQSAKRVVTLQARAARVTGTA